MTFGDQWFGSFFTLGTCGDRHFTIEEVKQHGTCKSDRKTLRVKTNNVSHKKTAAGTNLYSIGSTQTQLLKVMVAAMEKLKKYLFKRMDAAKQSRVLDPTQLGTMSDITLYPHVIPANVCLTVEQSGKWKLYLDIVQPST